MKHPTLGPWLRIYRAFLKRVPPDFRIRFARGMEETFVDGLLANEEPIRRIRFLAKSYSGVVRLSIMERLLPSYPASHNVGYGGHNLLKTQLSNLLGDVVYSIRSLRRQPAFAIVAIVTIALGVGANSAIFSVVKGVLLEPLPFNEPDRLIRVGSFSLGSSESLGSMSIPDIEDIKRLESIQNLVGFSDGTAALTGDGEATIVAVTRVTEGLLDTYGVSPFMGRDLRRDENEEGAQQTVVVSYGFWQTRMGEDPNALGTTIQLYETDWEVVGVAPAGFGAPGETQVWRTYLLDNEDCARGCHIARAVGKLATGSTLEKARVEMRTLALSLAEDFPETNFEKGFAAVSLKEQLVGDFRTGLLVVLGAVVVVLLITCTNIAILLMVRSSARESEMAVRAALGAGRKRLFTQMLLESQVLAMGGAALGLAIAFGSVQALKGLAVETIPRLELVSVDGTVLLFTVLSSMFVALLFGLSPAVTLSRAGISSGLLTGGRSGAGRRHDNRLRSGLLAAEVAMSLILLTGSGLLLKTFKNIYEVDLGYETQQILRFTLSLPRARYDTLEKVSAFYEDLERQIGGIPGVASTGSVYGPPLGRGNISGVVQVQGRPLPTPAEENGASIKAVTPGYLGTMRIPVLRGRSLEMTDRGGSPPVAVVNETFVRENFPDEDPLGHSVYVTASFGWAQPTWEIVGVVKDIKSRSLTGESNPEIYVPQAQFGPGFMTVSVRGEAGVLSLTPVIRQAVNALDPNIPLRRFETVEEAVNRQIAPTKFYLLLIGTFAGLAVMLAAIGLYGVVAYLVSRRVRELGIRLALGAERGQVLRLVMAQGLKPALSGIAIGLVGSWAGARALESILYDVAPHDPAVLGSVAFLLLAVSVVAIFVPARRAAAVDPVVVMKAD